MTEVNAFWSILYILPDPQSFRVAIGRASRIPIAYRSICLNRLVRLAACDSRKYESVGSESERDWKCKLACESFVTRCEKLGSRLHVTEHGRLDRLTVTPPTFLSPVLVFSLPLPSSFLFIDFCSTPKMRRNFSSPLQNAKIGATKLVSFLKTILSIVKRQNRISCSSLIFYNRVTNMSDEVLRKYLLCHSIT